MDPGSQTGTLCRRDTEELQALDQAAARSLTHHPWAWEGKQVVSEEAEPRASMSTPEGQHFLVGTQARVMAPSLCLDPPEQELCILFTILLSP